MIETKPILYVVGAAVVAAVGIYAWTSMRKREVNQGFAAAAAGTLNEQGIKEMSPTGNMVNYATGSAVLGANSAQTMFNLPRYQPARNNDGLDNTRVSL